jgi:hypothetical protein
MQGNDNVDIGENVDYLLGEYPHLPPEAQKYYNEKYPELMGFFFAIPLLATAAKWVGKKAVDEIKWQAKHAQNKIKAAPTAPVSINSLVNSTGSTDSSSAPAVDVDKIRLEERLKYLTQEKGTTPDQPYKANSLLSNPLLLIAPIALIGVVMIAGRGRK